MKKKIKKHKGKIFLGLLVLFIAFILISFSPFSSVFSTTYDTTVKNIEEVLADEKEEEKEPVEHIDPPEAVKTIYMSACVAGTPSFRQSLIDLVKETELNSIIIDVKDFSGTIAFPTENPALEIGVGGVGCKAADMKALVEQMHAEGIYVIARVTVFQDPLYTKVKPETAVKRKDNGGTWIDHKGLAFVDVGAKEYWDYIVELSYDTYDLGFDEINFDYIRFPSDGNMQNVYYTYSQSYINNDPENGRATALKEFFKYLDSKMTERGIITSADIFGMTTTNYDDLTIGQVLENTLPYFDYVAPMVYPSHYPPTFNGYPDPNDYPHEVVEFSMSTAVGRVDALLAATSTPVDNRDRISREQLRPWLQDFDYGGDYGPAEVRTQIQATYDSGLDSWMLWAPSNRYTRAALQSN